MIHRDDFHKLTKKQLLRELRNRIDIYDMKDQIRQTLQREISSLTERNRELEDYKRLMNRVLDKLTK